MNPDDGAGSGSAEICLASAALNCVKREWKAAWLLRAVRVMDLTTLSGDDTPGRVRRLCAKARRPVRPDLVDALGVGELDVRVARRVVVYAAKFGQNLFVGLGADLPFVIGRNDIEDDLAGFRVDFASAQHGCRTCQNREN